MTNVLTAQDIVLYPTPCLVETQHLGAGEDGDDAHGAAGAGGGAGLSGARRSGGAALPGCLPEYLPGYATRSPVTPSLRARRREPVRRGRVGRALGDHPGRGRRDRLRAARRGGAAPVVAA